MDIGQLISILFFFTIAMGLGRTLLWLARSEPDPHPGIALLEMFGIGIALFSFLTVVFNLLHIPLNINIFLVISLIVPIYLLFKSPPVFRWTEWKNTETIIIAIAILIAAGVFAIMHTGAMSYPYLEDDDPWNHVQSATYIAREQTYTIDPAVRELNSGYAFYLEPYPPTYDAIMGLLRQLNDSVVWTMKFFNALMVGLTVLFCYLMARKYLGDIDKALLATIILACLPSFMSHFIWSQTLAILLFPIALHAVLRAVDDTSWRIPAIIAIASMLVTQPVVSFVFGVVVLFLWAFIAVHEATVKRGWTKTVRLFIVGAGGVALSFVYWGAQLYFWGISGFMKLRGGELNAWSSTYTLQKYSFMNELFFAPHVSRMDQAVGWGPIVTILFLIAIIAFIIAIGRIIDIKRGWLHLHLAAWLALLLYAVFSPSLGLPGFAASRSWAYLAIPLSLFIAQGIAMLYHGMTKNLAIRLAIVGVIGILIAFTSLPAKIAVQTSPWPPGASWMNPQVEVGGYLRTQELLPKNTRVFPMCGGDGRSIGFGFQSDPWNPDVAQFRSTLMKQPNTVTYENLLSFLQRNEYAYFTIDASCVRDLGINETNRFLVDMQTHQVAAPIQDPQGFFLMQTPGR